MPYTANPNSEPTSFEDGIDQLIADAMRVNTQWNPAYEGENVSAIRNALTVLLDSETLTPEQFNARCEGMRATLLLMRTNTVLNGACYDPTQYVVSR